MVMSFRPLLFLLLLPSALFAACGTDVAGPRPPNVILIVMDTTSAERCSVDGYARETTPCLEEVADEGLNFRNTWSPSGWTGPAHASIFTGLRPEHHGFHFGNRSFVTNESTTLAECLNQAGYRTGCFTNNVFITEEFGLKQGFEHHVPLRERAPRTHELALDWVRRVSKAGDPFFLFINDMDAHFEYTPPREFAERFAGYRSGGEEMAEVNDLTQDDLFKHNVGQVEIPPNLQSLLSDLYDAEIACLDREIGRLVARLEEEGILDDTLLVITSDHGENLGRHGLLGHKFSLHRTVLHVPLVIRLPGGLRAGEVRDEVTRLEDLFPTILEVCDLPIPPGLDGESLLGSLGSRHALAMRDPPEKYLDTMEKILGGRYGFEPLMADIKSRFDGRTHTIEYSDGRRLVFDVLEDPEELQPIQE
jgi:arylsulfatase A-like enzyme